MSEEAVLETPTTPEAEFESLDQLQDQITELNKKLVQKQMEELREDQGKNFVNYPLADVVVKLDKNGSDVELFGVTPPEVLFLVAEHHTNAGGNPITKIVPQKKYIKADPRALRFKLKQKYSEKKIMELFPGSEPSLPTSFVRAMTIGAETEMEAEGFLNFKVRPYGDKE